MATNGRGTLVAFHAHPDDECIVMGGTIARAADEGHRVVIVFATRGEVGEVADGFLAPGEVLAERREQEARRAAEILGAQRVEFLGYRDSGMADTETMEEAGSFWTADIDEAAARVAAILREEAAEVFTTYDERGNYGHPDHVQVHRVGVRAAELAAPRRLYAVTVDRDAIRAGAEARAAELPEGVERPDFEAMELGVPSERITTRVDVSAYADRKRDALAAHASQVSSDSFFLAMPESAFRHAFGTEWYMRLDAPGTRGETWIFGEQS